MTPEDLGRQLIAHLRAIVEASDAWDALAAVEADKALAEGQRVIRTSPAANGAFVVHDWHTDEPLGVFTQEQIWGLDRSHAMPGHWIDYDRVEDPAYNESREIYAAQQRYFELADAPFDWLATWESLEQVDKIRAFLLLVED